MCTLIQYLFRVGIFFIILENKIYWYIILSMHYLWFCVYFKKKKMLWFFEYWLKLCFSLSCPLSFSFCKLCNEEEKEEGGERYNFRAAFTPTHAKMLRLPQWPWQMSYHIHTHTHTHIYTHSFYTYYIS